MKIPIIISTLIIASAGLLGWLLDGRLAAAHNEAGKLTAEANQLGLSIGDAHLGQISRRARPDHDAEARQLAVEYNAEAKKWESVATLDAAASERYREIHERIAALDSPRLQKFITDVLEDKDTHKIMRAERAVRLLPLLAKKDAKAALALFSKHYDAIKISPGTGNVVPECLEAWGNYDPLAAVEWIKNHTVEFPEAIDSLGRVCRSAAGKDPDLAFTLISGQGLNSSDSRSVMHAIVTAAKTDDTRSATLAALRRYRDANKEDKDISQTADQMFGYFSWGFEESGIKAAKEWTASANLTPKELSAFCDVLSRSYDGGEHAEWIEWMGATLPPDLSAEPIISMISSWTNKDYKAAGNWLASAPEGPARNAAICGYAKTVFKHDPETAMQWLMTLPPGRDRDETLKTIHMNWPKDDPAAKEAFAKEHGIK